jgi:agarase
MKQYKNVFLTIVTLFFTAVSAYAQEKKGEQAFFTVKNIDGRWYFLTPQKKSFFSVGINGVLGVDKDFKLGAKHYNALVSRSEQTWARETITFLRKIGFNSIGCWSSTEFEKLNIPYFIIIEYKKTEKNKLVDIFDPAFEKIIEKAVSEECLKRVSDPNLVGYFLGNDLNWYGDFSFYMGHESYLFDMYFDLESHTPGKQMIVEFLKSRYGKIEAFNKDWNLNEKDFESIASLKMSQFNIHDINDTRKEFLKIAARHFYSLMAEKIRAVDKNHLILTDRFANSVPEEVLRTAGNYCDVISINYYKNLPDIDRGFLSALYAYARKPILITEFTFRAMDNSSGLQNKIGPDTTVSSQQERALHFKKYALSFSGLPFIVGYHWFQFFDDPQDGRASDNEDDNYGIVDQLGRPYKPLIDAMAEINPVAASVHRASVITIPAKNIYLNPRIAKRKGVKNPAFSPVYLDRNTLQNNIITPWGDSVNDGKMAIQKTPAELVIRYNSGYGWGCGLSIFSPTYQNSGYYDALGYAGIKIRMKAPASLRFFIYLNESGVGEPWKKDYPGANGADGESYSSDEAFGTGKTTDYYFDFNSFNLRPVWGNQAGNKIIDLQAINDIEIAIPGNQYSGVITVESIELY